MTSELTILPPPVVPGTTDQAIIVDELVLDGGTFGHYDMTKIRISRTNRKRFNETKLNELAASIKAKGLAQPILIRPVTPTEEDPQPFEIVAGERRFRAAIIAGCANIPAMCRVLSDLDALELQILENLQRDDPHALEEAEGYERLMLTHGYNADQLAEKLKKSRSYIYGRLKLCALTPEVREQFLDDKISAAVALLVARLPTPAMQVKAVGEILKPHYHNEQMSFRTAREHLRSRYMLDLKDAVFSIKDAALIAEAGSCTKCPKRTGNQPEVFQDEKNGDICTDPDCYHEKRATHTEKVKQIAIEKGLTIIAGEDAKKLMPSSHGGMKGGYADLDKEFYVAGAGHTSYRKLLGNKTPEGALLENPHVPGELLKVAQVADLEELIQQAGGTAPETEVARSAKERAREKEQEAVAKVEREYRRRLFMAIRSAGNPDDAHPWNEHAVAEMLFRQCPNTELAFITKLYGWDEATYNGGHQEGGKWISATTKICAAIHQLERDQVRQLIRDLTHAAELTVNTYTGAGEKPQRMIEAALGLSINATAIRAEVAKEAKAKLAEKAGKKKPKEAKSAAPAQAELPAVSSIDIASLDGVDAIKKFIVANPARLDELTQEIIRNAPHQIYNLEAAGASAGYVYSTAGWNKVDREQLAADAATEAANESAPDEPTAPVDVDAEQDLRPTIRLKPKAESETANADQAPGNTPIVRVKARRKTVAKTGADDALTPTEAWPFPQPSAATNAA